VTPLIERSGRVAKSALPTHIDRELVSLYRAWDDFERGELRSPVIDFDLAEPGQTMRVSSREQVLHAIEEHLARLRAAHAPAPVDQLVIQRLSASATYLRALLGERLPLQEYLQQTMGITPRIFDEETLLALQRRVATSLVDAGEVESSRMFSDQAAAQRFQHEFLIRDESKLPRQFAFYLEKWIGPLRGLLTELFPGLVVSVILSPDGMTRQAWTLSDTGAPNVGDRYDVRVQFAKENAYWKNWISGNLSEREITLRINTHPRHVWYQGTPEVLVLHEYCGHAAQLILWHDRLRRHVLPQFLGILTVHFPDQFLLEGLAEAMPYVLPGRVTLEKRSIAMRELQYYTLLVMNNVHVIANGKDGEEAALGYAAERLPFTALDTLRAEVRARTLDPTFRAYQYVYGIAKHTLLQYHNQMASDAWRGFLAFVFSQPSSAQQLADYASGATQG
jgi:hypothetical protein